VELPERRLAVSGETSEKADFPDGWLSRFKNAKMIVKASQNFGTIHFW
jgi:hypothetical protein